MSYSITHTQSFTVTNAKYLAAKVAADLKRMQQFYGSPSDSDIIDYEIEVEKLLKKGYLESITYGFVRNGDHIEPTLKYTAQDLAGMHSIDDDPGKIRPGADINGATFLSYFMPANAWFGLSNLDRENFKKQIPVTRSSASEPGINGYLVSDRTYSSGGRSLNRSSVKNFR